MTNAKDIAARLRELTRITGYATTKEAADALEAMQAENAKLRDACASGWGEPVLVNTLRAELESMRADAERYREIADGAGWPACFADANAPEPLRGADLDAAIDAAIDAAMKGTT